MTQNSHIKINEVPASQLKSSLYNPRRWSEEKTKQLTDSLRSFGLVDPTIVNNAKS